MSGDGDEIGTDTEEEIVGELEDEAELSDPFWALSDQEGEEGEEGDDEDEIYFPKFKQSLFDTPKSYYKRTPQYKTIKGSKKPKQLFKKQKGSGFDLGLLFKNDKHWDNV